MKSWSEDEVKLRLRSYTRSVQCICLFGNSAYWFGLAAAYAVMLIMLACLVVRSIPVDWPCFYVSASMKTPHTGMGILTQERLKLLEWD